MVGTGSLLIEINIYIYVLMARNSYQYQLLLLDIHSCGRATIGVNCFHMIFNNYLRNMYM